MSWTITRLKHVCLDAGQYGLNVSAQDYAPSGYRLIRTSDIDEHGRLRSRDGAVFVNVVLDARHEVRKGDLLISRSGTLGRAMLLPELEEPSTYAGYLVRFRPCPGTEPRFISYIAASSGFQAVIEADAVTSTIQNFNAERYANIRISIPSVDEQRRIADYLDDETAHIDRLRGFQISVRRGLDQRDHVVRDNLVDNLIRKVGELPLRRFASKIEQGASPSCLSYPRSADEWGVVKLSAVKRGVFYASENKRLPDEIEPHRQYELRDGDLLMTRANTPELVGDVAVVDGADRRLLLPDLIYRLRLERDVKPDFMVQVLLSTRVRGLVRAIARGSSQSMVKLRGEDIRELPVPQANGHQQQTLVSEVREQLELSSTLRASIDRQVVLLAERRQALITAAVTGQLDVSTSRGVAL